MKSGNHVLINRKSLWKNSYLKNNPWLGKWVASLPKHSTNHLSIDLWKSHFWWTKKAPFLIRFSRQSALLNLSFYFHANPIHCRTIDFQGGKGRKSRFCIFSLKHPMMLAYVYFPSHSNTHSQGVTYLLFGRQPDSCTLEKFQSVRRPLNRKLHESCRSRLQKKCHQLAEKLHSNGCQKLLWSVAESLQVFMFSVFQLQVWMQFL